MVAFMIHSKTGKRISVLSQLYTSNTYVTYMYTHIYMHMYIYNILPAPFQESREKSCKIRCDIAEGKGVSLWFFFFFLLLPLRLSIFLLDCFPYHL